MRPDTLAPVLWHNHGPTNPWGEMFVRRDALRLEHGNTARLSIHEGNQPNGQLIPA
nr:hypothetical protein [Alcanivorax nanhaiticus]